MKRILALAALSALILALASCEKGKPQETSYGFGTIKILGETYENVGMIYRPDHSSADCLGVWFVPANFNRSETSSWLKYYPEADKAYQVAFQLPDFPMPVRGYIQDWSGSITPIDDNNVSINASGTFSGQPISFTGVASYTTSTLVVD